MVSFAISLHFEWYVQLIVGVKEKSAQHLIVSVDWLQGLLPFSKQLRTGNMVFSLLPFHFHSNRVKCARRREGTGLTSPNAFCDWRFEPNSPTTKSEQVTISLNYKGTPPQVVDLRMCPLEATALPGSSASRVVVSGSHMMLLCHFQEEASSSCSVNRKRWSRWLWLLDLAISTWWLLGLAATPLSLPSEALVVHSQRRLWRWKGSVHIQFVAPF